MDLGCRCQPASPTSVEPALKASFWYNCCKESIHCMSVFLLHLLHLFFCILIIFSANSRYTVGIISLQPVHPHMHFFFCIFRTPSSFKILVENSLQCKVAYGICKTVYEFLFISSLCHPGDTLCDLIPRFLKLPASATWLDGPYKERLHEAVPRSAASAGICDRIMDTCFITRMCSRRNCTPIFISSTASRALRPLSGAPAVMKQCR